MPGTPRPWISFAENRQQRPQAVRGQFPPNIRFSPRTSRRPSGRSRRTAVMYWFRVPTSEPICGIRFIPAGPTACIRPRRASLPKKSLATNGLRIMPISRVTSASFRAVPLPGRPLPTCVATMAFPGAPAPWTASPPPPTRRRSSCASPRTASRPVSSLTVTDTRPPASVFLLRRLTMSEICSVYLLQS